MIRNEGAVDQIYFEYGLNENGLQPGCTSLYPEETTYWSKRLETHIRLLRDNAGFMPDAALSYHVWDTDRAAVLRRVNVGASEARNRSRALVGSVDVLNARLAPRLESWPGWKRPAPADGTLERVSAVELGNMAATETEMLQLVQERGLLVYVAEVLGRMLAEPGRPVSVIALDHVLTPAFVWALRAAGHDELAHREGPRPWTFSTWESRHDNQIEDLPDIVFLSEPPGAYPANVDRVIVNFKQEHRKAPEGFEFAKALVKHRLFNGPPPTRPAAPVVSGATDGVGGVVERPYRDQVGGDEARQNGGPRSAGYPAIEPPDPRAPHQGGGPAPIVHTAPPMRHRPGPVSDVPRVQQPTAPDEAATVVQSLARATKTDQFQYALDQISERFNTSGLRNRVRQQVLDGDGGESIATFIDVAGPADLAEKAVTALFGQDGIDISKNPDGRRDAATLIAQTSSLPLAKLLARIGMANDTGVIRQAMADRLEFRQDPPNRRLQRAAEQAAKLRASRNFRTAVACGAVAALLAAFFAGASLLPRQIPVSVSNLPPSASSAGQAAPSTPTTVAVLPSLTWDKQVDDFDPKAKEFALFVTTGSQTVRYKCDFEPKNNDKRKTITCPAIPQADPNQSAALTLFVVPIAGIPNGSAGSPPAGAQPVT